MMTSPPGRPPARPPVVRMPKFTPEQRERIGAAIDALLKRIREALRPLVQLVRQTGEAIADAAAAVRQYADTVNRRRPDRPAWASPYGPAPRPHRSR